MPLLPASPTRASLPLLTCLVWVALPGQAWAKDTDSNAQGFKAYEKGDTRKAHTLFEKALKQNPDNAFARLNRARTTTLLNQGREEAADFEYCDYPSNWIFRALADLSKAVEVNPALLTKIDEDPKGLKALKGRLEYRNWRKAVSLLTGEKEAARKVLHGGSEWLFILPAQIPVSVTLEPDQKVSELGMGGETKTVARWSLKGEGVELTPDNGKPVPWKVGAGKFYFNQGQDFLFELQLTPTGKSASAPGWFEGPLKAGPILGDCE
jgi:tetratricopeptide (TPR) repeat protein